MVSRWWAMDMFTAKTPLWRRRPPRASASCGAQGCQPAPAGRLSNDGPGDLRLVSGPLEDAATHGFELAQDAFLVDGFHAAVFQHDLAIDHDCLDTVAVGREDQIGHRVIERPPLR